MRPVYPFRFLAALHLRQRFSGPVQEPGQLGSLGASGKCPVLLGRRSDGLVG
jgi:hypothetical protein